MKPISPEENENIITPRVLQYTNTTVLWMKIVSYFLLVVLGLYSLYFVYQTIQTVRIYWQIQEQFGNMPGMYAPLFWLGILIQFAIIAAIFYIVSLLLRSANRFSDFVENKQISSLEAAFAISRRYWLVLAIFLSVVIVLIFILAATVLLTFSNTSRF